MPRCESVTQFWIALPMILTSAGALVAALRGSRKVTHVQSAVNGVVAQAVTHAASSAHAEGVIEGMGIKRRKETRE